MGISLKKKILLLFILFLSFILVPLFSVRSSDSNVSPVFHVNESKTKSKYTTKKSNAFKVLDESSGKILKIPEREFIYGAVASEMPARFETEALKAQAVACYTYFCKARDEALEKGKEYAFTINSEKCINFTSHEQMQKKWGNDFDKYYSKIKNAVDEVFGEIIADHAKPILAVYHAISSGKTEKSADVFGGELSYLTNVESFGDKLAAGYETKVQVSKEDFKNILFQNANDCNFENSANEWVGEIIRTEGGMVKEINLCLHNFKGAEIRNLFALRSSNFSLDYDETTDKFIFTVLGYGHGVGMSQCGAQYMAQQGDSYKTILSWYYPGTNIICAKS